MAQTWSAESNVLPDIIFGESHKTCQESGSHLSQKNLIYLTWRKWRIFFTNITFYCDIIVSIIHALLSLVCMLILLSGENASGQGNAQHCQWDLFLYYINLPLLGGNVINWHENNVIKHFPPEILLPVINLDISFLSLFVILTILSVNSHSSFIIFISLPYSLLLVLSYF